MSLTKNSDKTFTIRSCRICLDTKCGNKVLIDEQNGLLSLFEYCFGITLNTQDEPRILCKNCADNVKKYAQFKEQCKKSDSLWKSLTIKAECCSEKFTLDHKNEALEKYDDQNINNLSDDKISTINNINIDNLFDNDYDFLNDEEGADNHSTQIKEENDENYFFNEVCDFENCKIEIEEGKLDRKENLINIDESGEIPFDEIKKVNDKNDSVKTKVRDVCNNNSVKTKVKNVFKCKMCKKKYEKKKWYLSHVKLCHTKKKKKKNQVFDHEKNDNSEKTKIKYSEILDVSQFFCGLCELKFTNIDDTFKHLNEHWTNNDLQCKLCEFVGCDLAAVAAHRYTHYPSKNIMKFLCHICRMRKVSVLALHFHYRQIHLKKIGGFCPKCNKEFSKMRTWKKHERTQHSTSGGYICDICGKKYMYKYLIKEHVIDHLDPKKHICEVCGNVFRRARYLKLHINTVHTKSNPVKCSHCNRMFKSEHSLRIHQNLLAREKPLKCEVCSKQFLTPNLLGYHMITHSDERPHCCNVCGTSYKTKRQLKVHMRNHMGYFPFKCQSCTKAFATSNQLKVHSSVHTGVRAHKCPYCERTFHSKKLVTDHCALRHKFEISAGK